MKGKLLRGINGSIQPRRLLHGYQDAVFAWSGEEPFANLAQSSLYRILPRTQYSDSWIESTPHGQAFRADTYSSNGHGYVFSSHVPSANVTYAAGVTGYAELVYSADLQEGRFDQHLCCLSSASDGNTGDALSGVLTLGFEVFSGKGLCPIFRVGTNTELIGFVGGTTFGGNNLVPVSIPVGTKIRQMVTFDPVSKAYASIFAFNDVVYEESGTVPNGVTTSGSSILVGGYPRNGVRAAYASGMLEAAIWNRGIPPDEMRALIQRPSIFQPTEFIFSFSFGESSGSEVINATPEAITLSPAQAAIQTTEILNTPVEPLSLAPAAASIRETVTVLTNPANTVLSGINSSVRLSEALQAKPATISLSGVTASIHITGAIEIPAKPAAISLSGVNAAINLSGQIQIDAKVATATLVASKATFAQHAVVNTQPDALVLQPVMAGLYAGEAVVDARAKALTLSPNQAAIVQHGVLATTAANIDLHGAQAGLYSTEILSGNPVNIILQGNQALIQSAGVVDTWPDSLGIFGQPADISMRTALATNLVNMAFDGLRAQINYQSPLVWGGTTIEARLQGMTIEARLQDMTIEARQ